MQFPSDKFIKTYYTLLYKRYSYNPGLKKKEKTSKTLDELRVLFTKLQEKYVVNGCSNIRHLCLVSFYEIRPTRTFEIYPSLFVQGTSCKIEKNENHIKRKIANVFIFLTFDPPKRSKKSSS